MEFRNSKQNFAMMASKFTMATWNTDPYPRPISRMLFSESRSFVVVLPAVPILKCHFNTGKLSQTKFFKQLISFAENDTLF